MRGRVTTTRRRALLVQLPDSYLERTVAYRNGAVDHFNEFVSNQTLARRLTGTQYTVSENHPGWLLRNKEKFSADEGGPFYSERKFAIGLGQEAFISGSQYDSPGFHDTTSANYRGLIVPHYGCVLGDPYPSYKASSAEQLDAFGTTAIARCKPANSIASLAETLLELKKDGLPKMAGATLWKLKTAKARQKAAAGNYLEYEFALKPLANDIANAAAVVFDADRLIKQYKRDAGKFIRRKYAFPPLVEEDVQLLDSRATAVLVGPTNGAMEDPRNFAKGQVYLSRKTVRKVWFSGAFVYFVPPDILAMDAIDSRSGPLKKFLGLEITPETIWNLTPWSWAVDWVSNTGDVISNLQSWQRDGMVMPYGYVMEHVRSEHTYTYGGPTGWLGASQPTPVTFVSETKQRRRATPFGFGLKYGDFSDRQKAIIAALGISKGK